MLFNSIHYIVFFFLVTILYWGAPVRHRWILLILASLVFYAAHIPEYIAVLALSVAMNFFCGLAIGKAKEPQKKKKLLFVGIVLNIFLLALFKYTDDIIIKFFPVAVKEGAFNDWFLVSLRYSDSPVFSIILPLGISFFTFTNIAYLVDVKRGTIEPEQHPGYFTVFVMFFPKLIQGPIERASHFLPQLRNPRQFDTAMATDGLRLLLWGFFKKLVIADRIGVAVDHIFDSPESHTGPVLIYGAILYTFQIYLDFSSYIDMGRGAAKILGFDLFKNFKMPYIATSIKDFWDRWHISLSTWLRDYLFLPIAFKTSKKLQKERYLGIKTDQLIYAAAASVTFLIAGLWHGTGWNFLFWGGLFAFYLIVANLTIKIKRRFYRFTGLNKNKGIFNTIQVLITFFLVTFAWIFFRADDLGTAFRYIGGIPDGWGAFLSGSPLQQLTFPGFTTMDLGMVILSVLFTMVLEYHFYERNILPQAVAPPRLLRWGFYYALLLLLFVFGKFESDTFIYFQF